MCDLCRPSNGYLRPGLAVAFVSLKNPKSNHQSLRIHVSEASATRSILKMGGFIFHSLDSSSTQIEDNSNL
jgi:hypothetical protein